MAAEAIALDDLDPECVFRAIALALATYSDTTRDHHKILAKADTFYDFIDPFALQGEGAFNLKLEPRK